MLRAAHVLVELACALSPCVSSWTRQIYTRDRLRVRWASCAVAGRRESPGRRTIRVAPPPITVLLALYLHRWTSSICKLTTRTSQ